MAWCRQAASHHLDRRRSNLPTPYAVTRPQWVNDDRWIPLTKVSHVELWCFLWCIPEQTVERTVEMPVIWDSIALIVTSLQWYFLDSFQLTAFQVFNGVCVSCAIQMLVYSSLAIKSCKNPGEEGQCVGDVIGIVASNGAAVAIGCMFVVIVVANYVMYGLLVRAVKTCSSSCKDGGESGQ